MSKGAVEAYAAAWVRHVDAGDTTEGRANLEAILPLYADDIVYEDVPSGDRFEGRDRIAEMFKHVSEHYDVSLSLVSVQSDGERFAIEFTSRMTLGDKSLEGRGAAVGSLGPDGKVTSHRDYSDATALVAAAAGS
jgi:limonene-1,2-epoxide hydrolase